MDFTKKNRKSAMYGQLPIQKTTKMQTVKVQCMVLHIFVIYTDKWYLLINFDLWWFLFPRFCIDFFFFFEEFDFLHWLWCLLLLDFLFLILNCRWICSLWLNHYLKTNSDSTWLSQVNLSWLNEMAGDSIENYKLLLGML